ncbi:hypothetical protein PIB30_028174, partial [Stylosanthes scabra]|nr:hypothetical protein [Stylosanthes scabra]
MAEIINDPDPSAAAAAAANQYLQSQKPLSIPISDKLTSDNFLTWEYQVTQTLSGQKLQHHLENDKIPKQFATPADQEKGVETQDYQDWRVEDYKIFGGQPQLIASL